MPSDAKGRASARRGPAFKPAPLACADKLAIDITDLATLTSLSTRTLRRLDAGRAIPGRVSIGRRVLFQTEVIRAWVRAGMPDREGWSALQKGARH